MNITKTSTLKLNLQNVLFIILFLTVMGLLAFLSNRYVIITDWTVNNQNSLDEFSIQLLTTLDQPVNIVSYTNKKRIKASINELIARYQYYKPDISLGFVEPNNDPQLIRDLKITVDGELIVTYQGRKENLTELSELNLTNALHRLSRAQERQVIFIQGHGERSPGDQANFDLSRFSEHLTKQGYNLSTINLAKQMHIPRSTAILVIAGPQASYLPGEVKLIIDYVKAGGNILWLADPMKDTLDEPMYGLQPLSELLGIELLNGVVVDPTTQQFGITRPDYAIISDYPRHPLTSGFSTVTLFPQAAGIEILPVFKTDAGNNSSNTDSKDKDDVIPDFASSFEYSPFLITVEDSWIETSFGTTIEFSDLLDITGPVAIGLALTRTITTDSVNSGNEALNDVKPAIKTNDLNLLFEHDKEQRIVIIGDGDFLSNSFLGNAGNLSLGANIFNWLSHDEQFINIPVRLKNDIILDMTATQLAILGSIFLFAIPIILLISGIGIWLYRRNRR